MIPPCKPVLPDADTLYSYLREIDGNQIYTNFGPLVKRFEGRLAQRLFTDAEHIVTTASGTSALELGIMAMDLPAGSYVVLPSWTFIATAQAVLSAGLKPFFADVAPGNWTMTPDIARAALSNAPGPVSLVLTVSPFGVWPDMAGWEAFVQETGISAMVDGAAMSPDDIRPSATVPVMISLHATKLLNAGEGGAIVCRNQDYTAQIRRLSNFGLCDSGVTARATNAKMSEYHAAMALAALDEWDDTKAAFYRIAKRYRDNLDGADELRLLPGYGEQRYNSFCLVEGIGHIRDRLHEQGIITRPWWRKGCHREPLFRNTPGSDNLPVTEKLAETALGLPCYKDMEDELVDEVCETTRNLIASRC